MKRLNFVLLCLLSVIAIISCDKEVALEQSEISTEENASLFYVKDDMNGMDMITDNINHILFIGLDSLSQGTIIEGGKMDTNSDELIKEDAFVVYVDSLNRVTSIIMDGQMCNFYNYTETTCDIAFINGDGTYECVEDISLVPEKSISKTRSLAGEELIDGTLKVISGVKSSLELALSICSNPKSWQTAFNTFDYISGMFSGGISFGMNSASIGLKAQLMNIKPDLFSLCVYLIESGRTLSDFLTEQLIGNWELELINVEQTNANMAEIVFQVSGVKENPSVELSGYVWYMNVNNKDANTISFKVENNTYKLNLPLNSYGSFVGSVSINGAFGFFKRKEFKFDAFHIGVKNVAVEDNPLYENGSVNFLLSINLEGSEDGLKDVQQFGYYTRFSNATPNYHQVTNLSSIFDSTPLTCYLAIEKEGFFDENINYTTFEARAVDYYIGAYVVLNNGNIVHIDEKPIEGLVYNTKPSLEYLSSNIIGTEITSIEVDKEGNQTIHYKTYFQNQVSILGSFWIEYLEWQCEGNGWEKTSGDNWYIEKDGVYNTTHFSTYTNGVNLTHNVYYIIHLANGSSRRSDNYLTVSGSETITNVSIIGSRLSKQKKFVVKRMQTYDVNTTNTNSIRK